MSTSFHQNISIIEQHFKEENSRHMFIANTADQFDPAHNKIRINISKFVFSYEICFFVRLINKFFNFNNFKFNFFDFIRKTNN